ncbi:MAG: hypothetical protein KBD78_13560 [Oligoflexales bacterium]|nr:hypothetical protein [Oligoflexales bacterium]
MNKRIELRELANNQGGYFTARQADALGFPSRKAKRFLDSGEWVREMTGIYRLAAVPLQDPGRDENHLWLLWSIGRKATKPRAALAYETVLSVYALSDLMPSKVHLSVPKSFKVFKLPKQLVLHREERPDSDITMFEGLRVIKLLQTIIDLLREGRVSREHIEKGFIEGIKKGYIRLNDVEDFKYKLSEKKLIKEWMRSAGW